MADKDVEGILSVVEPHFHSVVVTALDSERAMPIDEVAELARQVFGEDRGRGAVPRRRDRLRLGRGRVQTSTR